MSAPCSSIYISAYQNNHKVFAWSILMDRLSTRELLKRKNMELQDYTCVLCNNSTEESLLHLMIDCPFASDCWGWFGLHAQQGWDINHCLEEFRRQLHVPFFMEIIILMSWSIWQARNGLIFNNRPPSIQEAKRGRMCAASASCKKLFHFYWDMVKQPLFNLPSEANFFFISFFVSWACLLTPPTLLWFTFKKLPVGTCPSCFPQKKNHLKHLHVLPCLSAIELPTA